MRSRAGLRVVLHADRVHRWDCYSLNHAVVQVHVRDDRSGHRSFLYRVVMVLCRDLHVAVAEALYGVIGAVVSKGQLVGTTSECLG